MSTFSTSVSGKCILSGEHSVLRGVPALVVPLKSRTLEITFNPESPRQLRNHNDGFDQSKSLQIIAQDEASESTKIVLWGVFEKALSMVDKSFSNLAGTLKVKNSIPFGAGLGASAALCVCVARLFRSMGWIPQHGIFEFARNLENIFHGESSGVDVAVVEQGRPIKYIRGVGFSDLHVVWKPTLYLSYSGMKGVTSECVKIVQKLVQANPTQGKQLDSQMAQSVLLMEEALTLLPLDEKERISRFVTAMNLALDCYSQWGLLKGPLEQHVGILKKMGSMALKPTGSGLGGHVLSIWSEPPENNSGISLTPLEF